MSTTTHWRNMEKCELERQHSPNKWSHRLSAEAVVQAHVSALTEGGWVITLLNVPYGEGDGEKLDVYLPKESSMDVSLVFYIHGGRWQIFSKEESGFLAVPMAQNGVVTVAVDYDIAPKGNMDLMVSQVRRSVVSVVQQYSHIRGLYLVGHSAGTHLAAMVLSTDWSQYSISPQINGALLVSGIYDLLPILSTKTNDPLKMTEEVALRNSPMKLVPEVGCASPHCHIVVALAEHDSPAFRSQSDEYYKGRRGGETMSTTTHWRNMENCELERQYSPSQWSHRLSAEAVIQAHVSALTEGTLRARDQTQTLLNVPYGEGDGEKLDVYIPKESSLDVSLVFYIHGGYWQFFSKEESGFLAVPMAQNGVVTVAVDYDIAPKGNMDLMVSQVRRSVVSVVQQYSHIRGLYLVGHSAGAHLAAMVLSTDWSQYSISPQINGALLVSGIYDLLPILSTKTNDPLKMTEEVALRNSPMKLVPEVGRASPHCHIVVAVAEHDSPAFRSQSDEYYKGLKEVGLDVVLEDVPDTDHFDIIERMVDGQFDLTQLLLKMMGKS